MTDEAPLLYLPHGQTIQRSHVGDGKAQRAGFSIHSISNPRLDGAMQKIQNWRLLYDMYLHHPYVYAAVEKIVKVATNTGFDFVPRDSRAKVKTRELKTLKDFFAQQHDFIGELRKVYRDLIIFGDGYLYVIPDRRGRPARLKRLAPWTIHIKAKLNGEVTGYVQYDFENPRSEAISFKPQEMLHFKIDDPANDLYGLSPLESIKATVATDLNAIAWNKNFFANGASTGAVFIVEEATDADIDRARAYIKEIYTGTDKAHSPLILPGKVKVEKSITTHTEMGFLEGREQLKKEILAVLDVPPAKVGDMETANRSNSKEQDKTFRTESVSPLQNVVEGTINDQLVREVLGVKETIFRHSKSDVRDAQEQMDLWTDGIQNGIYNINEVRAELGKAPVVGGDVNYVMTPTGAVPVPDIELYFKLPQTNTEDIPPELHSEAIADGTEGPSTVGPVPKPTSNTETGNRPATKALPLAVNARATRDLLAGALDDAATMRQAWVYALDVAEQSTDRRLLLAAESLGKAVKTNDPELRRACVERAQGLYAHAYPEEAV